ncbi:MAG TPA: histidine phosphatase family protein, partial [Minicystis sp.]|nr:histidine phosphatase family protein [Minicystis sp.]
MLLYVMRHGPAEDTAPSGRDRDRRLTVAGRSVVERAARELSASRTAPLGRILTSPLVRARETAEIVWRIAGDAAHPIRPDDALAADAATPIELLLDVARAGADALLVGHNPNVEDLVREVVRGPMLVPGFRTATILAL